MKKLSAFFALLLAVTLLICNNLSAQIDTTQSLPVNDTSVGINSYIGFIPDSVTGDVHYSNTYPISITPAQGSMNASPFSQIKLIFNNPIDPLTVDASSFIVRREVSGPNNGTITIHSGNTEIRFTPATPFKNGEVVRVYATENIWNATENIRPFISQFTVITRPSEGIFASGTTYSTEAKPLAVFVYDLDRDGDGDIVCANSSIGGAGASNISVLMNNGDGTFAPKVNYVVGIPSGCANPCDVHVHDLDGDGDGDIAVVNICGVVSVLKNNGNGTFGAPTLYSVAGHPDRIKVADLDGDGDGDIIVSGGGISGAGKPFFSVMLNNGDGTFGTPAQFHSGTLQFGIYIYDVDGDGDGDAITSNTIGRSVSVSLNNGYGAFHPPTVYPAGILPRDVYVSDLDGDGDGDFVVANQTSTQHGTITVYKNNGNGTFSQRADYVVNGSPGGFIH